MSIIESTSNLNLIQYKGDSVKPAFLANLTNDMKKIDDYSIAVDSAIATINDNLSNHGDRINTLEGWKTETVEPALSDYSSRISAIESVIETVSTANVDHLTERLDALEQKGCLIHVKCRCQYVNIHTCIK